MAGDKRLGRTLHENSREEEASGEVTKSNCWLRSSGYYIYGFGDQKRALTNQPVQRKTPPWNGAFQDPHREDLQRDEFDVRDLLSLFFDPWEERRGHTIMLLVRSSCPCSTILAGAGCG